MERHVAAPHPTPIGATLPTRGREGQGRATSAPSPLWGGERQQGGGLPHAIVSLGAALWIS